MRTRPWAAPSQALLAASLSPKLLSVVLVLLIRPRISDTAPALMAMLGMDLGPARLPNGSLSAEQTRTLRGELETLGIFDWVK